MRREQVRLRVVRRRDAGELKVAHAYGNFEKVPLRSVNIPRFDPQLVGGVDVNKL